MEAATVKKEDSMDAFCITQWVRMVLVMTRFSALMDIPSQVRR
jgi:hypothetical protein